MEDIWSTIIQYNTATWLVQYIIAAIGGVLTALLLRFNRGWMKMAMKVYLVALYLWISIAYYLVCSTGRNHYDVMAIFWGVMAAIWLWDAVTGYSSLQRTHKYDTLAYLLLAMPIVYPLIGLARGLSFPEITSIVMPSTVVVFTLGLLLLFAFKVNLLLILFLCHWLFIGLVKTSIFKIPEDFILALAAVPALYTLFRVNFFPDPNIETKPSARSINYMLMVMFGAFAAMLIVAMYLTL